MAALHERVARVDDLLALYARRMDDDPAVDPADHLDGLMSDLRHWAAREGAGFARAWALGTVNFEAELRGEDEDVPRDLEHAHPELFAMIVAGDDLDDADWQVVNDFLHTGEVTAAAPRDGTDLPDPPDGVIDNIYRAARVDDLVATYAARTGLQDDEPYTQLADFLCDLRHWSVLRGITIAAACAPAMAIDIAPWQRGARMWVEEMLGEDVMCDADALEHRHPDLVRRVLRTLELAPGQEDPAAEIRPQDFRALNRSAYWDLNPDAPRVTPPEIRPLDHELFG